MLWLVQMENICCDCHEPSGSITLNSGILDRTLKRLEASLENASLVWLLAYATVAAISFATGWVSAGMTMDAIFAPPRPPWITMNATAEQLRVTSPDRRFDALIMQGKDPDTQGPAWGVYIVSRGAKVEEGGLLSRMFTQPERILQASSIRGANLVWQDPHLLEVDYEGADINDFRNLWVPSSSRGAFVVEITLHPSAKDAD